MIRSKSYCFHGIIITIYFLFYLLSLPNTFASLTRSSCRRDQRDALLEVQKEFHVPTTSWNKSVDCCSWNGVTCDAILGEVISLELFSSNITANTSMKFSSALFKLRHLRELDLQDCRLQGEIPSSIGNLSHLITSLDLSRNHLVGEVPASVGNLNQLRTMSLSENKLRGNVPTTFANLTKLSELDLSGNQFTGGDIVLANLTSLSNVKISFNHFKSSIFDYLSGLHNLNRFLGYGNSFSGPFPSSLLMISSLVEIGLGGNQFVGSIDFMHTSSSSRVEVLDVSDNGFDGLIPESISKLRCLYTLDVSHNNFGGRIPRSISKLRSLINLHLSYNNLLGRVPRSVSKLANLSSIDLSYNKLEGLVPDCLWRFSKLRIVQLSSNSFSSFGESVDVVDGAPLKELHFGSNLLKGPFPQWICKLRDLWALDFSNNHINGSIPQCLKNSNLLVLNLRNNSFGGFLPDLFINGSQLQSLDVSRNNLVGKLPKSLINCEWLEFLNVKENKIKDMFPFWLGSNAFYGPIYDPSAYLGFPSLKIIDISNNNFVGLLPQDYFANWTDMSVVWSDDDLPGLEYLGYEVRGYGLIDFVYKGVDRDFNRIFLGFKAIDFSGNKFSGQIPRSIGLMSELRVLNLSGNTFTGNIPPSLANITNLEALDLSQNNLSGEIPQSLGKLSFLSYINVSHNQLEGLVPQSTQFGSQNCSSFAGNPGLYGLEEICKESHHVPAPTSQQPEEFLSESKESVLNWIAAAIAFGPGVFCGLVIGHIFTSYKHEWFITR